MTNHEQPTSSKYADEMRGLPTDRLENLHEFLRKRFDELAADGGYDHDDSTHVDMRNRMMGAAAVLSERGLREESPEEELEKDDDPRLRYALTVDGGVHIVTKAGADQIDAGGNPDPKEIRVALPLVSPAPTQQTRRAAPVPAQPISTPTGRRVILQ